MLHKFCFSIFQITNSLIDKNKIYPGAETEMEFDMWNIFLKMLNIYTISLKHVNYETKECLDEHAGYTITSDM